MSAAPTLTIPLSTLVATSSPFYKIVHVGTQSAAKYQEECKKQDDLYWNIASNYETCAKMQFDADTWLRSFHYYSSEQYNREALYGLRKLIARQTQGIGITWKYHVLQKNKDGDYDMLQIQINADTVKEAARASVMQRDAVRIKPPSTPPTTITRVTVYAGDCLECAQRLLYSGLNPVVLNLASEMNPGGGWQSGAGAQEENLFRRSLYFLSLTRSLGYPMPESACAYSPNVLVYRSSEATGYATLAQPYPMSFIAMAAFRKPETVKKGKEVRLTDQYARRTKEKMRSILHTGLLHGHNAIVLGAMGCGAFRNPPAHIAQLFHQVIEEDAIKNRYQQIWFAIFDDHNAHHEHNPEGNVRPFQRTFAEYPHANLPPLTISPVTTTTSTSTSTDEKHVEEQKYAIPTVTATSTSTPTTTTTRVPFIQHDTAAFMSAAPTPTFTSTSSSTFSSSTSTTTSSGPNWASLAKP